MVEATEQLVVKVRMMRAYLVLHDQLTLLQQVFGRDRLLAYGEINFLFELVRKAEVDDWFACGKGLFDVV